MPQVAQHQVTSSRAIITLNVMSQLAQHPVAVDQQKHKQENHSFNYLTQTLL